MSVVEVLEMVAVSMLVVVGAVVALLMLRTLDDWAATQHGGRESGPGRPDHYAERSRS